MMKNNPLRLFLLLIWLVVGLPALAQSTPGAERYQEAMSQLGVAADEYSRWCALNRAAKESLNEGHDAEARSLAEELQRLAPKYAKDWNYGNAIQDYNVVLGRIALKRGDAGAAKGHLLAAGRSPGSPQMNSFGPNMSLAKELLSKGEKEPVLAYLELCRKFWKLESGKLDEWKESIEHGQMPDFGANLYY